MTTPGRPPLTFDYFPDVPTFTLTSSSVRDGEALTSAQVADSMGYHGENRSPQLSWSGHPEDTKSFAVTVHDPDAPTGSGFWHWALFDVAADVHDLAEGAGTSAATLPAGACQVRNDAGTLGYVGAAPPPGDAPHRYVTAVHALDVGSLELDEHASPAVVGFHLRFHTLARAQLVPTYGA